MTTNGDMPWWWGFFWARRRRSSLEGRSIELVDFGVARILFSNATTDGICDSSQNWIDSTCFGGPCILKNVQAFSLPYGVTARNTEAVRFF